MSADFLKNEKSPLPSLTPRLELVASYVRHKSLIADIGTDHAYLPVYLVNKGICRHAVASDIREGPLDSARSTARFYKAEKDINFVLADGLDGILPNQADDIVIAGMGGGMIADIISRCGWLKNPEKHLILQPMTAQADLNVFLAENGFNILKESVAYEGRKDKYYLIISCCYDGIKREMDTVEAIVGKLPLNNGENERAYIKKQADVLLKKARGLRNSTQSLDNEAEVSEQTAQRLLLICKSMKNKDRGADNADSKSNI